ncbi:multidrug efflux SMR transporter [Chromobacterium sp. IIBBL 290-4]|uniref:DMT family transporter n=1 Tax=Chromobacterium sp. IIBBL 290-4 TaxID=2953890 RepID=UPI0020B7A0D8|nr:SMR family transporter [Chromobacterium sp. IIBBL 290-4]UTH73820.1 SMR family transporter [Chromobacterium sp. IIBBL 290-4]
MNSYAWAWLVLSASIAVEIAGTLALRQSQGFSRMVPAVYCGACYVAAVWLMGIALRRLDVGVTYAVWAAGGTAGTAVMGMWLYNEPYAVSRLLGLSLIVIGVAVLNWQGPHA